MRNNRNKKYQVSENENQVSQGTKNKKYKVSENKTKNIKCQRIKFWDR